VYNILGSKTKHTRKTTAMTTAQRTTIAHIDAAMEAERFTAAQAAREVATLDPRSVLLVVEAKLAAGLVDEAKAIVAAYRASKGGN